MNKDQLNGRFEEMKGSIKEATGKLLGDKTLKTEGIVQKKLGRVQENLGDIAEDVKDSKA